MLFTEIWLHVYTHGEDLRTFQLMIFIGHLNQLDRDILLNEKYVNHPQVIYNFHINFKGIYVTCK